MTKNERHIINSNALLAQMIIGFGNSKAKEDRIFFIQVIKQLGKMGKRLYKLCPDKELKDHLINLKEIIDNYELYDNKN